jgi:glycosyltransferase involved in cell wall biosynthesis/SAM-dependent methyltransferase
MAPTNHKTGEHGDLFRCRECGTVQQPSLPHGAALHDLYRQMSDREYLSEEHGRRVTARRLLDLLGRHVPRGRLLEVGCGHGLLLDEARRRGYVVNGIELSEEAALYARERLDLPVREIPVEHGSLDRERYDAILLIDVVEHLDDPRRSLARCTELLAPGGALLVATPDPSAPIARMAGRGWWSYIPAHYCLIPRVTLRELLSADGLVVATDVGLRRTFSLAYWLRGLGERAGRIISWFEWLTARLPQGWTFSLSLGDERVVIACQTQIREPTNRRVTDRNARHKIHVVLPAYNAQRTVERVATAIPVQAVDRALLVDDASRDGTVEAALNAGLEVLQHSSNRGYGANQKTCYVRAALDGADIVVMVHADDQYDPSFVAAMVKPIEEGRADVVIGSRLLEDEAIAGGMPRWKWIGNRALTRVENWAFGLDFSEYHTGFRAFSVPFLRTIPFLRNSDDFVFDQEIFVQLIERRARITELAIPTRYFLEASSVSLSASVVYGLKTLRLLLQYRNKQYRERWLLLRQPATNLLPASVTDVFKPAHAAVEVAPEEATT